MAMRTRRLLASTAAASFFLFSHSKNLLGSDLLDSAPSRFAWQDGAKVHYKSLGDPAATAAVVFVHGWSCDMTSWRAQVRAFEGKARVLLLDLPGHGESDRPDGEYTMERFADAVEAVLRDAKVERALVVGHSMGTPVARQFLRKFPQKTLGLVARGRRAPKPLQGPRAGREVRRDVLGPGLPGGGGRLPRGDLRPVDAGIREGGRAEDDGGRGAARRRQRDEEPVRSGDLEGRRDPGSAAGPRREESALERGLFRVRSDVEPRGGDRRDPGLRGTSS